MSIDRKPFEAWILGHEKFKKPLHMESAWLGWQAAIKRNDADYELSSVPCAKCGKGCVEFTIPNEIWNAVIRPDGREHDEEYLCIACWEKALQSYLISTSSQPSELELHRADYNSIKAAGFESPGELLAAYNVLKSYTGRELNEFIEDESDRPAWFMGGSDNVVCVSDFRAWMTGYARVPLTLLKSYQSAIEAGQFMGFDEEYEQMQAILESSGNQQ